MLRQGNRPAESLPGPPGGAGAGREPGDGRMATPLGETPESLARILRCAERVPQMAVLGWGVARGRLPAGSGSQPGVPQGHLLMAQEW